MEKRQREEDEAISSQAVKKLRDSLLENIDDDESTVKVSDQDLASFMKTFENEITGLPSEKLHLSFLSDASDDELGLPKPVQGGEPGSEWGRVDSEVGNGFWEEPDGFYEFDRFEFGEPVGLCGEGDESYVSLDRLFDYSDIGLGSGDVLWRPDSEICPGGVGLFQNYT